MTCLHDISEHLDVDRQHHSQWTALQDDGITDINLLEHVWKGFDSPATELVSILEASGMLCPISTLAADEDPEEHGEKEHSEELDPEISKYIVPFHLKKRSIRGKWERRCRKAWDGICNSDKVLVFDFHSFLPPALFHYFIVRTGAKSKASNGMRPIIANEMAIFSFGDSYFILTESCQKHKQIKISARQVHIFCTITAALCTCISSITFIFLYVGHLSESVKQCELAGCISLSRELTVKLLYPNIYTLLTKREVKMAGYWPRSFLRFYGPRRSRGP